MGKAAVISSFGPSGEGGAVSLAPCPVAGIALSMNRYRAMEMRIRAGKALLLVGDVLALLLAMIVGGWLAGIVFANGTDSVFAARLWNDAESRQVVVILCSTFVAMVFIWRKLSHYSNRKSFWSEQREILMVLAGALVIDAALAFMIKSHVSRGWMISFWAVAFLLVPLTRLLVKLLRKNLGWLYQPFVVVGSGLGVLEAIASLNSESLMGSVPVAILTPERGSNLRAIDGAPMGIPQHCLTPALEDFLMQPSPLRVVFVLGAETDRSLHELAQRVALSRDDVYLAPAIAGLPLCNMEIYSFFSHEVLFLRARNNLNRRSSRLFKRAFDMFAASLLLLALSPLFIYVVHRVRKETQGPAFFTQERVGYRGQLFPIYKFRSMVANADAILEQWKAEHPDLWSEYVASNFKLAEDPRVTPFGRWIRRTSIDELPQLINVVLGNMSLVGPRPLLPRELEHYGQSIDIYANVKPGITGLWQISGRSRTTFERRIAMDRWYIRNWSIWHDLIILLRTVNVVFTKDGAH